MGKANFSDDFKRDAAHQITELSTERRLTKPYANGYDL